MIRFWLGIILDGWWAAFRKAIGLPPEPEWIAKHVGQYKTHYRCKCCNQTMSIRNAQAELYAMQRMFHEDCPDWAEDEED